MRTINEAIIHCTATRRNWMKGHDVNAKRDEFRRWHVEDNGWDDIGYHYIIDYDGSIAIGRTVPVIGAHVSGHNDYSIGIALVGGHGSSETDQFQQHYTDAQDRALRKLLDELKSKYGFTKISGHNEYAAKACPGFSVKAWYKKGVQASTYVDPIAAKIDKVGKDLGKGAAGTGVGWGASRLWASAPEWAIDALWAGGIALGFVAATMVLVRLKRTWFNGKN